MVSSRKTDIICLIGLILMLLLTCLLMYGETLGIRPAADENAGADAGNKYYTDNDLNGSWDTSRAVRITLKGNSASVSGGGAYFYDDCVVIKNGGYYLVTGELKEGRIIVDADKSSKVWVMLSSAGVHCSDNAPFAVEQADKVFLTLAEGTVNYLTAGDKYNEQALAQNVNGVLWSRDDLTINGTGTLHVGGGIKHGIKCNDSLVISGGNIEIECPGDALHANDSLHFTNADMSVRAGDDGLKCDKEIRIDGGSIMVAARKDVLDPGGENDGGLYLGGGCIVAAGGRPVMETSADQPAQGNIRLILEEELAAGSVLTVSRPGGDVILEKEIPGSFRALLISSPQIIEGEKYTVSIGDACRKEIEMTSLSVSDDVFENRAGRISLAADGEDGPLSVAPFGVESGNTDVVYLHQKEDRYYLFLPAGTNPEQSKVYFTAQEPVYIDDIILEPGGSAAAFTEGEHTLSYADESFPLTVCISDGLPALFIVTREGGLYKIHKDKNNKEPAAVRIYEDGLQTADQQLEYIKCRGNGTFELPKKAYTVKFPGKTPLLGMDTAKKWVLLANALDPTLLRNVYGWTLAEAFGLKYSSDYRFVDLYINGDYKGNYCVCEKPETGEGRIEIRDLDEENESVNPGTDIKSLPVVGSGENGEVLDAVLAGSAKWVDLPAEPNDISGGYLLEIDPRSLYNDASCGFVTDNGQIFVIREPEYSGKKETEYIASFVNEGVNALYAEDGYNREGRHYSEYFDLDSMVNMYILQELSHNLDAGFASQYLIKENGSEKVIFAPVWDLDHAFGNSFPRYGANINMPDIWWANSMLIPYSESRYQSVYSAAYRHEDFREAVRKRWDQIIEEDLIGQVVEKGHLLSQGLAASGCMNLIRWKEFGTMEEAQKGYDESVSIGETFINERISALNRGFSADSAMLYYDANGGRGFVFNRQMVKTGETVEIIDYQKDSPGDLVPPEGGYEFAGWNTMPDGSGKTYLAGDSILLEETVTTLYAVWEKN